MAMSSRRPYLIRAMYEWVIDNGLSPHLLVATDVEGVVVPPGYEQEGKLTLNVSPRAVRSLNLGNDWISFSARFGGQGMEVGIPPRAVLAVYARENGEGMLFGEVEAPPDDPGPPDDDEPKPGRSHLKVVK